MQRLRSPMTHAAIRDLRRAYEQFQRDQNIAPVIGYVVSMDGVEPDEGSPGPDAHTYLTRDDLHMVCFDYIWG